MMVVGEKFLAGVAGGYLGEGKTNIQLSGPVCCYSVNPFRGSANRGWKAECAYLLSVAAFAL